MLFMLCWFTSIVSPSSFFRHVSNHKRIVFLHAHNRQKESETKDEDEGENLSKNSPIKTWKWKHKSTRNRFESEILAGIKKKEKREDKHTTLKKIRGAFRARSARFSHHFHSRDSDYVSCQCTERTLFFNYRTLIECDLVIDCSIAAWAREKRGGKNCFHFSLSLSIPIQTPRAGVNHQNMSFSSPRVQFTAIVYNWWFIVLIKGPEILSLFTQVSWSVTTRSKLNSLVDLSHVFGESAECEIWKMSVKSERSSQLCMRARSHRYRSSSRRTLN